MQFWVWKTVESLHWQKQEKHWCKTNVNLIVTKNQWIAQKFGSKHFGWYEWQKTIIEGKNEGESWGTEKEIVKVSEQRNRKRLQRCKRKLRTQNQHKQTLISFRYLWAIWQTHTIEWEWTDYSVISFPLQPGLRRFERSSVQFLWKQSAIPISSAPLTYWETQFVWNIVESSSEWA
jgi:hypothetical protein